jgi:hypothetical protein
MTTIQDCQATEEYAALCRHVMSTSVGFNTGWNNLSEGFFLIAFFAIVIIAASLLVLVFFAWIHHRRH